jgi:hypothetical protein
MVAIIGSMRKALVKREANAFRTPKLLPIKIRFI